LKDRVDAGVKRVAPAVGEFFEVVAVLLEELRRRLFAQLGELDGLLGERDFQLENVLVGESRRVPDRLGTAEIAVLLHQGYFESRLPRDGAARRIQRAGDNFEERGFATAVSANDAPPVAFTDAEGDIGKQGRGAEFNGDVGNRELGHP
jgi:hypothetical protein